MAGHVGEDCFGVKLSLILGIMNSTDRREEKRNFLIQGRRFRRSFKNYCNYRYFMKLSRLLSIVKLGIDVLLSEHLQLRCIDSSMYRYTPSGWGREMSFGVRGLRSEFSRPEFTRHTHQTVVFLLFKNDSSSDFSLLIRNKYNSRVFKM